MFNSRQAKLLAPGAHLTIPDCPGLRLEATQKTKAWTYRFRSLTDGKLRQVKLGLWPDMSSMEAQAAWEKARAARNAGQEVTAEPQQQKADQASKKAAKTSSAAYTVRKLVDAYLDDLDVTRKAKGAAEVRRMFDTMLEPIETMPAAEVTRRDAFALLDSFKHIPVQASKLRSELGAAWVRALDAGELDENAPNHWKSLMRGKLKSKGKVREGKNIGTSKRFLNDQEAGELLRWLPNFSRIVCDALTLYLWTGARGAEIVAMEAREISEEADGMWWTCPKAKTKNARIEQATDLRVPLVGRAEAVVRRLLAVNPKGYLFKSRSAVGHIEQKALGVAVWYHMPYSRTRPEHERPRLPVVYWAPHDLRRTTRTKLSALGCPKDVAEAVIGHVQPGIEGVYNLHAYDSERRVWLTTIAEYWEGLADSQAAASPKLAATRTTPQPRARASRPAGRLTRVA